MNLRDEILRTIRHYSMMKKGDRVLIALSGGSDSIFLLHMLASLKTLLGLKLYIAHMDHGVRGSRSCADWVFVKRVAKSFKIKCAYKKLNFKKTKSKLSFEEILRLKRYEFLRSSAKKFKLQTIATAHTLDDQAETVLMRIVKGSSLKGVMGIHPTRSEGHLKFVRPVIEIEKKEILKYLKIKKILFRTDETNFQNNFLRNKIRNRVLPYLAGINPRIKHALLNLSASLREDFEFIEEEKKKRSIILKTGKNLRYIALKDILLQPAAMRKELVRESIKLTGANVKKLKFSHWKDVDELVRAKPSGKVLNLPDGVSVEKTDARLIFSR